MRKGEKGEKRAEVDILSSLSSPPEQQGVSALVQGIPDLAENQSRELSEIRDAREERKHGRATTATPLSRGKQGIPFPTGGAHSPARSS